jgi:hypothetical protein
MSNGKKVNYEPLPENEYLVRATRFEERETKNGGKMISAGFEVINGDFKNRLVFHNFLVEHSNPKAQQIGTEQLDRYLKAVGVDDGLEGIGHDRSQLSDYTELPFIAKVAVEEGGRTYTDRNGNEQVSKARNKITSFKAR